MRCNTRLTPAPLAPSSRAWSSRFANRPTPTSFAGPSATATGPACSSPVVWACHLCSSVSWQIFSSLSALPDVVGECYQLLHGSSAYPHSSPPGRECAWSFMACITDTCGHGNYSPTNPRKHSTRSGPRRSPLRLALATRSSKSPGFLATSSEISFERFSIAKSGFRNRHFVRFKTPSFCSLCWAHWWLQPSSLASSALCLMAISFKTPSADCDGGHDIVP